MVVRENHATEGDAAKHVDGDDTRRLLLLFDERLIGGLFRLAVAAQIFHLGVREAISTNENNETKDCDDQENHEIEGNVVVVTRDIRCDVELDYEESKEMIQELPGRRPSRCRLRIRQIWHCSTRSNRFLSGFQNSG